MTQKETYVVVEHDGGWAYRVGNTYSETFRSREAADAAAVHAAAAQRQEGHSEEITYEDENGHWHHEHADGRDRPKTGVEK